MARRRPGGWPVAGRRPGNWQAKTHACDKATNHMLRQDPEIDAWRRPQTHDQGWPWHVVGSSPCTLLCTFFQFIYICIYREERYVVYTIVVEPDSRVF